MSSRNGLMTEKERSALAGEQSQDYRYYARSKVRERLRDGELTELAETLRADLEALREHHPEAYDLAVDEAESLENVLEIIEDADTDK